MSQIPVIREFEIKRSILTKKFRVEFLCPYCKDDLVVQEKELENQRDECPQCLGVFVLHPSAAKQIAADLESERAAAALKQEARALKAEKKREEAEQREEAAKREAELELRKQEAEAQAEQERQYNEQDRLQREAKRRAIEDAASRTESDVETSREQTLKAIGSWEERYPNLARYLELGELAVQIVVAGAAGLLVIFLIVALFQAISSGAYLKFAFMLLYGLMTAIPVALFYLATMAGIEFVKVICNIEQESAITRVAVQKLANRSDRS
jgi:hypothetical protein